MATRKLSLARRIQKRLLEHLGTATDSAASLSKSASEQLSKFDEDFGVSDVVRAQGAKAKKALRTLDDDYDVSDQAREIGKGVSSAAQKVFHSADQAAQSAGIYETANSVSLKAAAALKQTGLDSRLEEISRTCETLYGSTRNVVKPYFLPESTEELLSNTKNELSYISACIMQVSHGEAEKLASQFGVVVASKVAGVAASGVLLSLVSTFGTAGTGTAIAGLSGAASTSATLAWVGGLFGGGMAAGAALTGGVSIVVAMGAYKALGSEKRDFETLDEVEQRILQYCWMLIAILDDYLGQSKTTFTAEEAKTLLAETLLPLHKLLEENATAICSNLDKKNTGAYRQHVLRDFEPAIIEPFQAFIEDGLATRAMHHEQVIGGVLYALLTKSAIGSAAESQLVLDALRRAVPDLAHSSEAEISSHLASYSEEQIKGLANNVKGIYFELLWVSRYNANHSDTQAELFESPYHPGADVRIKDIGTGDTIANYQLKATNSVAYVNEHLVKYPEIAAIATDEVASKMEDVTSSGILNADLTSTADSSIDALSNNTLGDRVLESAGLTLTIATGRELVEMLQGRKEFPEAAKKALNKTGTATAATAVTAYLFS